ncbi:hypothetical protein TcCL_NonESM10351 [Trypanosoma cruzi]|nr:hypothetical protein TcCL_NonESM10351 [Trypanosoma cruzi]
MGQEMPCSCRGAALPGCGGEWGPDTEQLPRHRGATHCGRTQQERTAWCCWDAPAPAPSHGRQQRGTNCSAAAVTCKPKLRSLSIALPSRRTGWDLTRGFLPYRNWLVVSSSDRQREKMQNRAAPLLSALILGLCLAAHVATTDTANGIAAAHARPSAPKATSMLSSTYMNADAK